MDQNNTETKCETNEEARSQEIQNLKTYLEQRFGKTVLPGDPRIVAQTQQVRFHNGTRFDLQSENSDGEVKNAVSGLDSVQGKEEGNIKVAPDTTAASEIKQSNSQEEGGSQPVKRGRGGGKATRFTYTHEQVEALVAAFNMNPYPTRVDRESLEVLLGLSSERIRNWFQNRRSKERRKARQNNTPLPAPLLLRDMGQASHLSYPTPSIINYKQPDIKTEPALMPNGPSLIRRYLRSRIPGMMEPPTGPPQPSRDPGQLPSFRANWPLAWPSYHYPLPRAGAQPTAQHAVQLPANTPQPYNLSTWSTNTWPYYDSYPRVVTPSYPKPHTITSEQQNPDVCLNTMHQQHRSTVCLDDYENNSSQIPLQSCTQSQLPPVRETQVTWYEEAERHVDLSADDAHEESLHLDDTGSIYSGNDSQSDAGSFRSLLDESQHTNIDSVNSNMPCMQVPLLNQEPEQPQFMFPLNQTQSFTNYNNYSPITPPLAQDLDPSYTTLDSYAVYSYDVQSNYSKVPLLEEESPATPLVHDTTDDLSDNDSDDNNLQDTDVQG